MNGRRFAWIIALFCLISFGAVLLMHQQTQADMQARRKLDAVLGEPADPWQLLQPGRPEPLPDRRAEAPPEPLPAPGFAPFFNIPLPQAAVDVQETETAYTLRIPLADPKDADHIRLDVTPNRIAVSGQTGRKQGGATITSSFMQTFATRSEVLPDKVTRQTERRGEQSTLVITIPKRTPGQPDAPASSPAEALPPQPPGKPDPFEGHDQTVI